MIYVAVGIVIMLAPGAYFLIALVHDVGWKAAIKFVVTTVVLTVLLTAMVLVGMFLVYYGTSYEYTN